MRQNMEYVGEMIISLTTTTTATMSYVDTYYYHCYGP